MIPTKRLLNVHGLVALVLASAACLAEACSKPSESAAQASPVASTSASASLSPVAGRRIDITATDEGFKPSSFDVKKGEQVVLRFTRTTKSECLKAVAIPDLGIKQDLPLNAPIEIPVKPEKEGKLAFQCWMGMVHGTINVTGS